MNPALVSNAHAARPAEPPWLVAVVIMAAVVALANVYDRNPKRGWWWFAAYAVVVFALAAALRATS